MEVVTLKSKVIERISKILELDEETVSAIDDLSLLGMDSMKTILLVVDLEETLDIIYMDEELLFDNFLTVDLIVERAADKLGSVCQ